MGVGEKGWDGGGRKRVGWGWEKECGMEGEWWWDVGGRRWNDSQFKETSAQWWWERGGGMVVKRGGKDELVVGRRI